MIGNEVEHQFNSKLIRSRHEIVEIFHRSVIRFDGIKVANIVSSIDLRRCKNWAQPTSVHACVFQVIQFRDNA